MIEVRRIEHGSPVFEVVVREGKGDGGQAYARALSRERDGDLALFPRVRREMPRYLSQSRLMKAKLAACRHAGCTAEQRFAPANVPQAEAPARREERQL